MIPEVLARDLVLRHARLQGQVRGDRGEHVRVGHEPQPDGRTLGGEQPLHLDGDALARQVAHVVGRRADRGERGRLDREVERRREPDGADHAQRVLVEALGGIADRPQRPGGEIDLAAVRVDETRRLAGLGAPGHRVDREVAPGKVQLDRIAELDPMRPAEVGVVVVGPKGRDRDVIELRTRAHGDGTELVLVERAWEQLERPFRQRRGREVPIEGGPTQQRVAHRSTHHVRGVPAGPQRAQEAVDGVWDRAFEFGRHVARSGRQFRPRNR